MSIEKADRVIKFRIHGMDCAEEVTLLKRELIPLRMMKSDSVLIYSIVS